MRNWARGLLSRHPLAGLIFLPRYLREWRMYVKQAKNGEARFEDTYPCLADRLPHTPFDPHYFYQGAWLARRLVGAVPLVHVDIGSDIRTVSVISASVETIFVDYRPLRAHLPKLHSAAATITRLPFRDQAIKSLSCLHVIEHIGLGRYGDPLDPEGSRKAARELQRVLAPGGTLYISLPVGRERVCFNAHRVLSPSGVAGMFPDLNLRQFSFVDDQGVFHSNQDLRLAQNCEYGCGMFEFSRETSCQDV